ncbi:MAG: hypothetical protein FGM41_01560 [Bacteroidetes bacterium]|nr:hypothetical protein [Bacteroidota bacterium]
MSLKILVLGFALSLPIVGIAQQDMGKENIKKFHTNGKLKEKGSLKSGQKTGIWVYYHAEGWMEKKEKYKEGVLIWAVFYNARHQITKSIDRNGNEIPFKGCNCKN